MNCPIFRNFIAVSAAFFAVNLAVAQEASQEVTIDPETGITLLIDSNTSTVQVLNGEAEMVVTKSNNPRDDFDTPNHP